MHLAQAGLSPLIIVSELRRMAYLVAPNSLKPWSVPDCFPWFRHACPQDNQGWLTYAYRPLSSRTFPFMSTFARTVFNTSAPKAFFPRNFVVIAR